MIAAIVLERGLALPGLGPSCVDAMLFLPTEDGPAVFMTAETMWFVVGFLASAGRMMVWPRSPSLLVGLRRCSLGTTPS